MNVLKSRLFALLLLLNSPWVGAVEFWSLGALFETQKAPDFEAIQDSGARKAAFFNYLAPKINQQNNKILQLRRTIRNQQLDADALEKLYRYYRVNLGNQVGLLNKLDIVPTSLVLAQAAYESNWGRSRFAKRYHNFFGLWCFTKGCGVVPKRRDVGATHEVAKFASVDKGIAYYLRSINRNRAYQTLRAIRKHKRENRLPISGIALAEGLVDYAAIGYDYVETVQQIIRYNQLERYD